MSARKRTDLGTTPLPVDVVAVPTPLSEASCLALLPDDDTCVIGGEDDGDLYVASLRAGRVVKTLTGHAGPVNGLSLAADGQLLLSGSNDGTVRVWDSTTWRERAVLEQMGDVWAVASAGTVAVVATGDVGAAQVWDLTTGECRGVLAAGAEPLIDVAISPDGRWVATVDNAHCVLLGDLVDTPELDLESFLILANDYDCEEPIQLGRVLDSRHSKHYTTVKFDAEFLLYTIAEAATIWEPVTGAQVGQLQTPGKRIDALAASDLVAGGDRGV